MPSSKNNNRIPAGKFKSSKLEQVNVDTATLLQQGLFFHKQAQWKEARSIYETVLKINPNHGDALHLLGMVEMQTENHTKAIDLISKAIRLNPKNALCYSNIGISYHGLGLYNEAIDKYNKAISLKNDYTEAYFNRGNSLRELKMFSDAIASYDLCLKYKPDYAESWYNRGIAFSELSQFELATHSYEQAIRYKPNYAKAYYNLGLAQYALEKYDDSVESYNLAVNFKITNCDIYYNLGNAQLKLKQYIASLESFSLAIGFNPEYSQAYAGKGIAHKEISEFQDAIHNFNRALDLKPDSVIYSWRALVHQEFNQYQSAVADFDCAIQLDSNYFEAYSNRGLALLTLKKLDLALASFDVAISLRPEAPETYSNRALVLLELKRFEESLAGFDKAISLNLDYSQAYSNRGIVLLDLKQVNAAIVSFDRAIYLNPLYAEAHSNKGLALLANKQLNAAIDCFENSIQIRPDARFTLGMLAHSKMKVCNWSGLNENITKLEDLILQEKNVTPPFVILALSDAPSMHKKAAKLYANSQCAINTEIIPRGTRKPGSAIRIAYFSADFHNHATAHLIAGLFEYHNKEIFEIFAFSFGPDEDDEISQRLIRSFHHFYRVKDKTDSQIAMLSRSLGIDIAIDLKGYTQDSRPGIFSLRCAPIQINFLGYPGTMGVDFIDYIIADPMVIPLRSVDFYSEKVIYMPDSYQVNDSKRQISSREYSKKELGLPPTGFVFCCFNNNYKITPSVFAVWMNILKSVEGSVLWLLADNDVAVQNLLAEANLAGVASSRLVFASRMPSTEHLARHHLADLFLDTFPCNAHTTASDALWAGLPLLTLMGESFASRVAGSLLNAMGLPELITHSIGEYENLAKSIALNMEKVRELKNKIIENKYKTALFNTELFAKNLEQSFVLANERYQAGLPNDHIFVKYSGQAQSA